MDGVIIEKLNNSIANYLVFSISSESPLFFLDELEEEISFNEGEILVFDQLLQTGEADNRFMSIVYHDKKFDYSSVKHIDNYKIDSGIRGIIAEYLRRNIVLLKYSILLSQQKEHILKGGIV
jgi:hypothetical protein